MAERQHNIPDWLSKIWHAEDGRCEACGRPTDQRAATLHYGSPAGAPRLICGFCDGRIMRPFSGGIRLSKNPKRSTRLIGKAALTALAPALDAYGVLLTGPDDNRIATFWLPGVGKFGLRFHRPRPDGTCRPATLLWGTVYPKPALRPKPQARTRGLPRLSLPLREGEEMPA